jgi:anti-sigma regulatory factor (Ser/Thr protein kinase)
VNDGSVALRLPADAGWLSIVRLFVGSSGRLLELDDEIVEDAKLVVTELCSAALEQAAEVPGTLAVEVRWTGADVTLSVRGMGLTFAAVSAGDVRAQMLDALVPELRVLDDSRAVEFRLAGALDRAAQEG